MNKVRASAASGTGLSSTTEPVPVSALRASIPDANNISGDERSFILYAETCCVDGGGILIGERMNAGDHAAAKMYVEKGFMFFGRIPSELLNGRIHGATHWCELTLAGWELAWQCRRKRADKRGPYAKQVFSHELTLDRLAAQGMETRQGGDGTAPSRSDDSPVGETDAP